MSAGKKVFTKAGEYLAEFLLTNETKKEDTQLLLTIDTINSTGYSGPTQIYMDSFKITREQLIEYFKNQLLKELSFTKITDGTKELIIQEAVQKLFNELKYLDTLNQAQFEALVEMVTDRLAEIYKNLGLQNRKFTMNFKDLSNQINELRYKPLDYFRGGEADKARLYYRFDGKTLLVSDGAGNASGNFNEVFSVSSVVSGGTQTIGDTITIGGTEPNSPFEKIRFTKEIYCEDTINMLNGAELNGTALRARYADLAEMYTANNQYPAGTLLEINISEDLSNDYQLTIYDPNNQTGCFGVVTHKPGFVLNSYLESTWSVVGIALTGQTPVNIANDCNKGDLIYPSPYQKDIGMAIAIKPENKSNFESTWPNLKCIGQALDTDHVNGPKKVNCRIW